MVEDFRKKEEVWKQKIRNYEEKIAIANENLKES